jgi:hypothetical protein
MALLGLVGLAGMIGGIVWLFVDMDHIDIKNVLIIEGISFAIFIVVAFLGKRHDKKAPPEEIEQKKKMMAEVQTKQKTGATAKMLAMGILYLYGAFNIIIGLIPLLFDVQWLKDMGIGIIQVIAGLVFVVLGYLVSKKSLMALSLSILIVFGDLALLVYRVVTNWSAVEGILAGVVIGIVIHIWILGGLFSGVKGIRQLKKADKAAASVTPPESAP